MSNGNYGQQLLKCLRHEGEFTEECIFANLLKPGETWQDVVAMVAQLHNNFERFGCVEDIARFIDEHDREGLDILYAALGELDAVDHQLRDLQSQKSELDAQINALCVQSKQMCLRLGVPYTQPGATYRGSSSVQCNNPNEKPWAPGCPNRLGEHMRG